jgi:hypothetical protein
MLNELGKFADPTSVVTVLASSLPSVGQVKDEQQSKQKSQGNWKDSYLSNNSSYLGTGM